MAQLPKCPCLKNGRTEFSCLIFLSMGREQDVAPL